MGSTQGTGTWSLYDSTLLSELWSAPQRGTALLHALRLQHGLPTPQFTGFPVTLWDVYGKQGHPVRATISDMGPLLLSRMLGLNDTQEGVLNLTFKVADDNSVDRKSVV